MYPDAFLTIWAQEGCQMPIERIHDFWLSKKLQLEKDVASISVPVHDKFVSGAAKPEPMPIKGKELVLPHVVNDLMQRDQMGKKKYGTSLETHNNRSSLWDAYQELLDLTMYLRKHLLELENKKK